MRYQLLSHCHLEVLISRFNPRDLWRMTTLWLHVDAYSTRGGISDAQFQHFCVECWDCCRYMSRASAETHVCPGADHLDLPTGESYMLAVRSCSPDALLSAFKERFSGVKVPGLSIDEMETYFMRCVDCDKIMTRASSAFHDDSIPE